MTWQHFVRDLELRTVLPFIKGRDVLEIGGGDGYTASLLTAEGFNVTSIDVSTQKTTFFNVQLINAEHLLFADQSFDVVFSSHAIAHIHDKESALAEVRRVLKPGGIAVHIVPSPWWSILTNSIHALKAPKMIAGSLVRRFQGRAYDSLRSIVLHPLGTSPSFVHEIFKFSPTGWEMLFKRNGFRIDRIERGPLVQSGYRVLPFKLVGIRKFMAGFFPSSYCFVTSSRQPVYSMTARAS